MAGRLRRLFVALLGAGLLSLICGAGVAAAEPVTETGYITLPDGVRLKYTVAKPSAAGRFPIVLLYQGYDAGTDPFYGNEALPHRLLDSGFAILGVNVRGSGCSGGSFDIFEPQWARDGYDIVEWAAGQPWSNGKVAMYGESFAGIMQLFTAALRPPHLVALSAGGLVTDLYRDVAYPGGIYNASFSALFTALQKRGVVAGPGEVAAGDAECAANVAAHEAANTQTVVFTEVGSHPFDDGFYTPRSAETKMSQINVPILLDQAWQDEQTGGRAGHAYALLDPAKTWIVGANGHHLTYSESPSFTALSYRFMLHYMTGTDNGFERTPHVQLYHESQLDTKDPRWITSYDRWPVATTPFTLHLRAGGLLSKNAPARSESPDRYDYPVPAASTFDAPDGQGWKQPVPPGGSIAYTTPPLDRDRMFFGPASLNLWLSSSTTDTDLQATITEVRPDGQEEYVQRGWLRASHRAIDPERSTDTMPFQTHREADSKPLDPNVPTHMRLELFPFNHVFRKGSSIRVWVEAPVGQTGLWGFQYNPTPATNALYHDPQHDSQLVLGLLPEEGAPVGLPACDTLLSQPCRESAARVPSGDEDTGGASGGTAPVASSPRHRCLARRVTIGPHNIGRVRLELTRRQLRRRLPAPGRRTRWSWGWCVKGGKGTVAAAFSRRGRVALVATTAPGHGDGRVRPGARSALLRRTYPHRRPFMRGLVRASGRSTRLIGVRRGRVRYLAVASRRTIRNRRALPAYLRYAGLFRGSRTGGR